MFGHGPSWRGIGDKHRRCGVCSQYTWFLSIHRFRDPLQPLTRLMSLRLLSPPLCHSSHRLVPDKLQCRLGSYLCRSTSKNLVNVSSHAVPPSPRPYLSCIRIEGQALQAPAPQEVLACLSWGGLLHFCVCVGFRSERGMPITQYQSQAEPCHPPDPPVRPPH